MQLTKRTEAGRVSKIGGLHLKGASQLISVFDRPWAHDARESMRTTLLAFGVTALAVTVCVAEPEAGADQATGSICVLPFLKPAAMPRRSPVGPPAAEEYSLRLDLGTWVPQSAKKPIVLRGIAASGKHKVTIRGDGHPFAAFSFSFDELKASDLCLWQSPMYQTWQLYRVSASFASCRCKGAAALAWQVGLVTGQ